MWEYPYSRPPHCGKQRNLNMKSRGIEALSSAGHNDNNQFGPDGQAGTPVGSVENPSSFNSD